ncbi:hypothetical protein O3M35_009835 [Rhynocoris fuscipes]|uniref:Uncharacterized protein n=1 Tax=Rhynocoris fuscipes TaxID=488301 RepID=A0AAW1D9N9_9HEMI
MHTHTNYINTSVHSCIQHVRYNRQEAYIYTLSYGHSLITCFCYYLVLYNSLFYINIVKYQKVRLCLYILQYMCSFIKNYFVF